MLIIPGSNGDLAVKLSKFLKVPLTIIEIEKLKNGEKYLRIGESVEGEEVYIVNTFYPNPDEIALENIYIADTVINYGAKKVYGIFPYIAYSRRGWRLIKGEAMQLKILEKLIYDYYDAVYTIDFYGDMEVNNISAMDLISNYFLENYEYENLIVIGPDEESARWIPNIADALDADYHIMKKIRIDAENVVITSAPGDLKNRDVLIVDDIISTGATSVQAVKKVKSAGARRVVVASTHALIDRKGVVNMHIAGADDIFATNTVLSPVTRIEVAELLTPIISTGNPQ